VQLKKHEPKAKFSSHKHGGIAVNIYISNSLIIVQAIRVIILI